MPLVFLCLLSVLDSPQQPFVDSGISSELCRIILLFYEAQLKVEPLMIYRSVFVMASISVSKSEGSCSTRDIPDFYKIIGHGCAWFGAEV